MKTSEYSEIIVESYIPERTAGYHGLVHIRPIPNQPPFTENMHVECSKRLSEEYPVGTRFRIRAKIKRNDGGKPFGYSHYSWPVDVL